jgi:NAD(P)-dependent dehydrogenase (short-subunit alcohol dehydrogenase family)
MSLQDKVVVITGAARGIGAEYAQAFALRGARLMVVDVVDPAATARRVRDSGAEAMSMVIDVRSRAQADAMVAAAVHHWGRVDVLVNNAARYAGLYRGPLQDIPVDEWDEVMAVNVRGVWNASAAALAPMRSRQSGAIINISSTTAIKGTPGNLHYVASKGAVTAMTRAMAREVGRFGVRVNCVTPGLVDNEASREGHEQEFAARAVARAQERCLSRDMFPSDLVGAVLFLASDESAFITGQSLTIDGGAVLT